MIDYIVECDKFHCAVCPAGEEEPNLEETEFSLEAVFVFDFEHMWVERLIEVKLEKIGLGDCLTFGKQGIKLVFYTTIVYDSERAKRIDGTTWTAERLHQLKLRNPAGMQAWDEFSCFGA